MDIRFNQAKRDKTLKERGLDFARADEVFAGQHLTRIVDRHEYGEDRYITAGMLDGRIVIMVWTPRGETCRIISMNGKSRDSERTWVDLDDAPEITEEWIKGANLYHGEKLIRRGRGAQQAPTKQAVSIRLSPEVLDYFRSTGKGWQTRLDEVLKEYVREQR